LFDDMIDWVVKKQFIVSIFIIEAKLLSMLHADKKLIWWIHFFLKLKFDSNQKIMIYNDNLQTIHLLISEIFKIETKLRHVDIAQCWLKQSIQSDYFSVNYLFIAKMINEQIDKDFIITKTSRIHQSIETCRCRISDQSYRMRLNKIPLTLMTKEVWLIQNEYFRLALKT
jgi:hypothetical protein